LPSIGLFNLKRGALMNKSLVKAELAKPEYEELTDEAKSERYNSKTKTIPTDVQIDDLQAHLFRVGAMTKLQDRLTNDTDPNAKSAATEVWLLFGPYCRMTNVDVAHTRFVAGMWALSSVGDIAESDILEITNMGLKEVHFSHGIDGMPDKIKPGHIIKIEAS